MKHDHFIILQGQVKICGSYVLQWSSTREDMFPPDFCDALSTLHDQAPEHSFDFSRREVEAALGGTLEQLFVSFERKPLASGSIAQVSTVSNAE